MNITYDIQKIKNIISDFSKVTGIDMALYDTSFNAVAGYEYTEPVFCKKIQSCEKGFNLCKESDKKMINKCKITRSFVSHTCHAGLVDSVMPVIKGSVITGYIVIGRVRQTQNISDIYKNIEWLGERPEKLNDSFLKIAYYNDEQLKCISRLVSSILFENAIDIELSKTVTEAIGYIDNHLKGKITVTDLCKVTHTSKNTLYRLFNDTFGCTINEYITEKRIEKSKFLLETSDMPIAIIGEEIGIENCAHFCRTFKKRVGTSPSAYRQQKRNMA